MTKKHQYEERDVQNLGDFYLTHLEAMTEEGLHEKSAIAAELAVRDRDINDLRKMLAIAYVPSVSLLYTNDGEFQDNVMHPRIDYRRDSVKEIMAKMVQRAKTIRNSTTERQEDENSPGSRPSPD